MSLAAFGGEAGEIRKGGTEAVMGEGMDVKEGDDGELIMIVGAAMGVDSNDD